MPFSLQVLWEEMVQGRQHSLGTWLCMLLKEFLQTARFYMLSKKLLVMIQQPCSVFLTLISKEPSLCKRKLIYLHDRLKQLAFFFYLRKQCIFVLIHITIYVLFLMIILINLLSLFRKNWTLKMKMERVEEI